MNPTTTSTATTTTSIVTSTTPIASTFSGAGPSLGKTAGRRRTLGFGFAEPSNLITDQGGRLGIAFIHALGVASCFQHQRMIDKICIDVGWVSFLSPGDPDFLEQIASNMKKRVQELDLIPNLGALVSALKNDSQDEFYKDERANLLDLLTNLLKLCQRLAMGETIAVLREPLSEAVGRLDIKLWPEEHTEPALSARSSEAKKSEKRDKDKKAEKGKGNSLHQAVKRLSMKFKKVDSNSSKGAQREIIRQQFLELLEKEERNNHGKDWSESSSWWEEQGLPAEKVKPASEHKSWDS